MARTFNTAGPCRPDLHLTASGKYAALRFEDAKTPSGRRVRVIWA